MDRAEAVEWPRQAGEERIQTVKTALFYVPLLAVFLPLTVAILGGTDMGRSWWVEFYVMAALYVLLPIAGFLSCFFQAQLRRKWFWFSPALPILLTGLFMLASRGYGPSFLADMILAVPFALIAPLAGLGVGGLVAKREGALLKDRSALVYGLLVASPIALLFMSIFFIFLLPAAYFIGGFIACFLTAKRDVKRFWLGPLIAPAPVLLIVLPFLVDLLMEREFIFFIAVSSIALFPGLIGLIGLAAGRWMRRIEREQTMLNDSNNKEGFIPMTQNQEEQFQEHMGPVAIETPAEPPIETKKKLKLLGYLLLSAITFSYLVLAEWAGISVLIFVLIQVVYLTFLVPRQKPLLLFIPIGILALNAFISGNVMWRIPNLFVGLILYSVMALWLTGGLGLKDSLPGFFLNILRNMGEALTRFKTPFRWGVETQKEHMSVIKRVCIGIAISIPCLIFLLIMLSQADAIFSQTVSNFFDWLSRAIGMDVVLRGLVGLLVGFYLFGVLYGVHLNRTREKAEAREGRRGDLIILNIVLISALLVYTFFVAVQFRYLFAPPDNLPYGLDFVNYARQGFFELLFLTGVNISVILLAVWLSKTQTGKWAKLTKILCLYLCAVTVVLLVSSFYRMYLYSYDDGFTRLRLLVFGFLIFEAIGLIVTFFYIVRPKFNIIAVYCVIALSYYLLLNLVPIDAIIAQDQIDRYVETGRGGIHYTVSLSSDAAPQVARLLALEGDSETRERAVRYFERMERLEAVNWRQWNLSVNEALRLGEIVR
ncbi:MAG: DUF4173 domain-containing protein [Oscillospiraceae bacterium]|nr:DUF4173 domain-containing protein [Oscillospiraceae bacterium]